MSEENKARARRFYEEVITQKKLHVIDELCDPAVVDHSALPGQAPGAVGLKQSFADMLAGLPDLRITVHDMIAEGDLVVARFTAEGTHTGTIFGTAPTGKRVSFRGLDMIRIKNGRAIEVWHEGNDVDIFMQLGVQLPSATS